MFIMVFQDKQGQIGRCAVKAENLILARNEAQALCFYAKWSYISIVKF